MRENILPGRQPRALGKKFRVTRMLTRDLFAVANHLVLCCSLTAARLKSRTRRQTVECRDISIAVCCTCVICRCCSSSCSRWRQRISWTRRNSSTTFKYFVNVTKKIPSLSHNRNEK